jgi:hypothetical protein
MLHSQGLSNNAYAEPNESNSRFSLRSILILSSHLHLSHPKGIFPGGLPVRILKSTPTFFYSDYMARPSQSSGYIHPNYIRGMLKTMKLLWSLIHYPFSSLLGPKIRLVVLFSNTLSLHSSLKNKNYTIEGNLTLLVLSKLIYNKIAISSSYTNHANNTKIMIKINDKISNMEREIIKGVKQRCPTLPILFKWYMNQTMNRQMN